MTDLFARFRAGDAEARDEVCRLHGPLVRWWARKYRGLDREDLVQEGFVGLLRAAELFDTGRGVQFSTYASYWIRQAMLRALAEQQHAIRVPACNREARRSRPSVVSVEVPVGRDGRLGDLIADGREGTADAALRVVEAGELADVLDAMPEHMGFVLRCRMRGWSLGEVAAAVGRSKERVRQVEKRALELLRLRHRVAG